MFLGCSLVVSGFLVPLFVPPVPGRGTSDTPRPALCSPVSRLQSGRRSDPADQPQASPQLPLLI